MAECIENTGPELQEWYFQHEDKFLEFLKNNDFIWNKHNANYIYSEKKTCGINLVNQYTCFKFDEAILNTPEIL